MGKRDDVTHPQQEIELKTSYSNSKCWGDVFLLKWIAYSVLPVFTVFAALLNAFFNVLPWDIFVYFTSSVVVGVAFWGVFTFHYMEGAGFECNSSIKIAVLSASVAAFSLCYTFGTYHSLSDTLFFSSATAITLGVLISGYLTLKHNNLSTVKNKKLCN